MQKLDPSDMLKPMQKKLPEISIHPLFMENETFKQRNYSHIPRTTVEKKDRNMLI
jgi:hypothetical protein